MFSLFFSPSFFYIFFFFFWWTQQKANQFDYMRPNIKTFAREADENKHGTNTTWKKLLHAAWDRFVFVSGCNTGATKHDGAD